MSTQHDSEGFMSTPLEGEGARRKDNYYQDSEENEVRFREADDEYQRLKEDFNRIARNRRTRHHSRSDSSKSLLHAEDSLRIVQRTCLSLK